MAKPTVAILGASQNRQKYGNKSVRAHLDQGYEVYPINPNADEVEGLSASPPVHDRPSWLNAGASAPGSLPGRKVWG